MHVRITTTVLSFALALGGTALHASAADSPCLDDAQKLCADVAPGEGRLQSCLDSKKDELSRACRMRIVQTKAELKRGEQACGDDAIRLCGDVEPGQGRVARCLVEHESELTPDCKAWTDQTRAAIDEAGDEIRGGMARLKSIHDACGADVEQFCADVPEGKGRRVKCLEDNASKLSDPCRAAVQ